MWKRGNGIQGDISLDDISSRPGPCPLKGNCDFENGLCTWTQVHAGDNFDWNLGKGGTSIGLTGPSKDHTKGTSSGQYIFIEASNPRRPGDRAQLRSQLFNPTSPQCINFWYNMYGQDTGNLRVWLQPQNGSNVKLWDLQGDKGATWLIGRTCFSSKVPFYLIIEAVRGSGYRGDIAVDGIALTSSCRTQPPEASTYIPTPTGPAGTTMMTTPGIPTPYDCNFETDLCRWTQDKTDIFDWTRASGPTGTGKTGPTNDHTLHTAQGHYIYIESSNPRKVNDTARIISLNINPTSGACVTFWYHMYGAHINTLNLYLKQNGKLGTPIWKHTGTLNNQWYKAVVNVASQTPFQMVFEGVRGTSYQGDIGLDDISYSFSPCSQTTSSAMCNFENYKICGYKQSKADVFDWRRSSGRTGSGGTGPPSDHTYSTNSGTNLSHNITFTLSPSYPSTIGSCLTFYYHMYGTGMGRLNVYLKQNSVTQRIFTKSGNQGNKWIMGQASLRSPSSNYTLMFEAIRRSSYSSDIAIDDVAIASGTCSLPGNCNFEKGFCAWTNIKGDRFDWLVGTGKTASQFTGPTNDHTVNDGSGSGHYAFIESSAPRVQGDTAWLQSPKFNPTTTKCLHFWYHMLGSGIGSLNVYVKTATTNKTVWS